MVEEQLIPRGIRSQTVLDAMRSVPRHLFVPEKLQGSAYDDSPLSIGRGQTISQPYIVAFMTEQLEPVQGKKILEIGTGSGYQAAILACLGANVYTIELLEEHAARAHRNLCGVNISNVTIKQGNGYSGWPQEAPFDAIIITAAPETIPAQLIEQLKMEGTMVVPVGPLHSVQSLQRITRNRTGIIAQDICPVRFVPMVDAKVDTC